MGTLQKAADGFEHCERRAMVGPPSAKRRMTGTFERSRSADIRYAATHLALHLQKERTNHGTLEGLWLLFNTHVNNYGPKTVHGRGLRKIMTCVLLHDPP